MNKEAKLEMMKFIDLITLINIQIIKVKKIKQSRGLYLLAVEAEAEVDIEVEEHLGEILLIENLVKKSLEEDLEETSRGED